MAEVALIAHLLNQTLSPDAAAVRAATDELDRLSPTPHFPFHLLSISTGGENQGQKIAAATYLKNHTRRNVDSSGATPSNVSKEFKDLLMQALLQVEFPVLKILVEVFRVVAAADFVKHSLWPDLVPNLQSAIQNSHLINGSNSKWNTINALIVLHALIRPFQYFLNPKIAKEPVPPQLELIAKEILVPLLAVFHQFVGKAIANHDNADIETEKAILTICKCLHFTVKSYMPLTLAPLLNSFSRDLMSILSSLSFDCTVTQEDVYLTRWKSGKRSLLIFSSLVTRHRKHSDKLMPDIINNALNIVKFSKNTSILPFLLERILSLGFDVISNVLETGPGWRLVSPHFTTLLESAIFPALIMNEKDMSEWEEDADEYIRKNLPSDIDEISGWREDLFTARKSAVNLLGVISMSKGPPMEASTDSLSAKRKKGQKNKRSNQRRSMGELLVLPFLSKFPIPSDSNLSKKKVLNDYFGVLLAYGGLQEFLRDQESGFLTILIRTRILPLYTIAISVPHLIASANWVLGELGSCLPEEMSADVYSQLLMALVMPDKQDTSCYPVRVSAAGAITTLLDNDYMPPDFLPLLQVIVSNIGNDENDSSILFQLLSSIMEVGEEKISVHIPHIIPSLVGSVSKWLTSNLEPWPQVVERGIATLAVMGQTWEDSRPEVSDSESNDLQEKWAADQAAIGRAFAALLQQVWLAPLSTQDQQDQNSLTSSCIGDLSTLLRSVMLSIDSSHLIQELKVSELLPVWAEMIAEWHAWEESEDLSIFDVIKEIVNLDRSYRLKNFLVKEVPPPPAPPVPERSIVEGIGTFVSEAIKRKNSQNIRSATMASRKTDNPQYGDGASPGKIFIGGLAKDTTLETFVKYFERYGEITDSVIMKDRQTGRPRGFGFITYADPSVVDQVIQENHIINDKQVEIKRTIPKGASHTSDFKTKKIFVGGIPAAVSEDELKNFFSKHGNVVEHEIIRDHATKRSRGFGFVVFDNDKVVDTLLADGNMIDMDGTQVEIKKAEPKKSSSSASFPPFGSDSRSRSYNDGFGGFGDSYGGFPGGGYGPASYRSLGGYTARLSDYGGYGGGDDFSGGFGGYGGSGGAGGYAGYRGESSFGYSGRYGSYMGGLGGGYGGSGLGPYGRGGAGYGSYGGSGTGGGYESGPGAGFGGTGGLYSSRGGYGGGSRYHPYTR